MQPSQIVAVQDVELEGRPGAKEALIWLYRDVVGLALDERDAEEGLCFRSGPIALWYRLVDEPRLATVPCRLVVEVRSLWDVRGQLDERGSSYTMMRGFAWTDRRLSMLDPAGNRIEMKQHWPLWF
jgi:hypothetical protein